MAIFHHHIFCWDVDFKTIGVPARLERDAVIIHINRAIPDVDIAAGIDVDTIGTGCLHLPVNRRVVNIYTRNINPVAVENMHSPEPGIFQADILNARYRHAVEKYESGARYMPVYDIGMHGTRQGIPFLPVIFPPVITRTIYGALPGNFHILGVNRIHQR